jgi:hypothetical protein
MRAISNAPNSNFRAIRRCDQPFRGGSDLLASERFAETVDRDAERPSEKLLLPAHWERENPEPSAQAQSQNHPKPHRSQNEILNRWI